MLGLFLGSLFCSIDPCVCFCISTTLFCLLYIPLLYCLKSGGAMPLALLLFFFPQDWFGNSGSLWLHINFRIISPSSVKNVMDDLIGIALNLYIALGSMATLTILICLIQEHGISFPFVLNQFPLSMFYSSQHISHLLGQVYP